jgi:SAM-dependent methyltransferase
MAAAEIPTKPKLHPLFLSAIEEKTRATSVCQLLDLGCGDGRLACELYGGNLCSLHSPLRITGVDVNVEAVRVANAASKEQWSNQGEDQRPLFVAGNVSAEMSEWGLPATQYDIVLLQLVISVIGGPEERAVLVANAHRMLKSGGVLLLSASGDSAAINEKYRLIYQDDEPLTNEARTYYSRDTEGNVLYTTHHFTEQELLDLLNEAGGEGFTEAHIQEEHEASSRRPDEAAIFYYAAAKRG